MLLGSPPDTVHGAALRRTDPSTPLTEVGRHNISPGAGIHPCCSGLQVQGTANSPISAVLPAVGAIAYHRIVYYIFAGIAMKIFTIFAEGKPEGRDGMQQGGRLNRQNGSS